MSEHPIVPRPAPPKKHIRGRLASGAPNPIDAHVGKRLRLRRMMRGLSQEDLGASLGVAFQQIQKYECAINRLSVPRLWELGRILKCPVSYFFEGLEGHTDADPDAAPNGNGPQVPASAQVPGGTPRIAGESIRLARAYVAIASAETRRQILDLASSLGPHRPEDETPDEEAT